MLSLSGHIGPKVSDLVDGQLSAGDEERAWSHVLTCPGCRRLVEREGWTKRQLGSLAETPPPGDPSPQLLGSLYAVDAWATVDAIEHRSRTRRTAVVVGGGAVGAAVLGLITITGGPTARTDVPTLPSPATVRGASVGGALTPTVRPALEPGVRPAGTETDRVTAAKRRSR